MAVYVDDMFAGYGRMTMCHMIADSTRELFAMAARIDVSDKWVQYAGTYREHFDICKSKRSEAVKYGAVEITQRELAQILLHRKAPPAAPSSDVKDGVVAARKDKNSD